MYKLILFFLISLFMLSCAGKHKNELQNDYKSNILLYEEGDTLKKEILPKVISDWISFYHDLDTGFTLGNFKASGVHLHISDLPEAISKGNENDFQFFFAFSPSKLMYLDLFSYSYILDNDKILAGEVDQQIVLGNYTNNSKKQLLYYGPSQSAETAGWLSENSFLIAILNRNENNKIFTPELMLFNINDSLYTNFQLDHAISLDLLAKKNGGFLDQFFVNK